MRDEIQYMRQCLSESEGYSLRAVWDAYRVKTYEQMLTEKRDGGIPAFTVLAERILNRARHNKALAWLAQMEEENEP